MYKPFVRGVLTAVCVSLVLLPESTYACCFCDWFKCCHKEPAPVCPPPVAACNVCPQQVSYVPQTCYRTEYTCVPCTSYRPVTTCDPCAGAQTVMQPVTTYVRRAVQVPYTTYRPVVTQMPAAPCATCGNANYYSPVSAPAVMPTAGCSTCGSGAAAVSYTTPAAVSAPAMTYGAPAASYGAPTYMPAPSTGMPSTTTGTPTLAPSSSQPSSTFQPGSSNYQPSSPTYQQSAPAFQPNSSMPQDNSSLRPIQPIQPNDTPSTDSKINPSSGAPLLQDPSNRTTSNQLMGPAILARAIYRPADMTNTVKPAVMEGGNWSTAPKADDGWRSNPGR